MRSPIASSAGITSRAALAKLELCAAALALYDSWATIEKNGFELEVLGAPMGDQTA